MARQIYADRVEVFAFVHPDETAALVRLLHEVLELVQRPSNQDAFVLSQAHLKQEAGEWRFIIPFVPEIDEDELFEDTPGEEYDLRGQQP